jgi:phosphoglucosamine mutase
MPQLSHAADRIGKELDGNGRVLIRWSGTEPKLRIMIEGPDEERLRGWAAELAELARRDIAAEIP